MKEKMLYVKRKDCNNSFKSWIDKIDKKSCIKRVIFQNPMAIAKAKLKLN